MVRQAQPPHHPEPSRRANHNEPNSKSQTICICNLVLVICYFRFIQAGFKLQKLNQRLVKLCQILLPFHGKQLLFSRVAFLAAGCHIAPGAFTAPGYRHNMIHGQFFRRGRPAAIVAHTFGQTAFPPLGFSKFPCFVTRLFQIFFTQIIGEWLDGFFSFHF